MIVRSLPLKTVGGLNAREHHMAKARRVKNERQTARFVLAVAARLVPLPVIVTMIRESAGTLDDDNLQGALKGVRDGIADAYSVDDRTKLIEWRYDQRKCKKGTYAVVVQIEARQ